MEGAVKHARHGHTSGPRRGSVRSPTYNTWRSMVSRCTCPSDTAYRQYGAKGVTVCERWRTFTAFLADMGERPEGLSLDRIDNAKGYEPDNCRWATRTEQNRRRSYTWHTMPQGVCGPDDDDDDFAELLAVALSDGDGLVAFIRAYIDESGIHDNSPVTTVAVILSKPTFWREWTKAWNAAKRPIEIFHAADCANLKGEFKGWERADRDAYVARLLPVIGQFKFIGHVMGIKNDDLARVQAELPRTMNAISSPYITCLQLALTRTLNYLNEHDTNDRIAFVHENNDHMGEALACFEWLKARPEYKDRRMTFTFAGKKDAPPLQAADCFAYEGNKRIRKIDGPERRAWRAMNPGHNKVRLDHLEYHGLKGWMTALTTGAAQGLRG